MAMALIDSHCHLDDHRFDADRNEVLERAMRNGINRIIVPSIDAASCRRVLALSLQHPRILPAIGLHPWFCDRHQTSDLELIASSLGRAIAIGECGLDRSRRCPFPLAQQLTWLMPQLELAAANDRPVILHAVRAIEPILDAIRPFPTLRGVVHSFYGSREQAERLIDRGLMLGIGSAVTHARNHRFRALIAELPPDHLLIETDAPDQPPANHHGQRNEPALLIEILDTVASLRGMQRSTLAAITTRNSEELFRL